MLAVAALGAEPRRKGVAAPDSAGSRRADEPRRGRLALCLALAAWGAPGRLKAPLSRIYGGRGAAAPGQTARKNRAAALGAAGSRPCSFLLRRGFCLPTGQECVGRPRAPGATLSRGVWREGGASPGRTAREIARKTRISGISAACDLPIPCMSSPLPGCQLTSRPGHAERRSPTRSHAFGCVVALHTTPARVQDAENTRGCTYSNCYKFPAATWHFTASAGASPTHIPKC